MDSLNTSRDMAGRERDRSRREERPSRFSDRRNSRDRDRSTDRSRRNLDNRVYVSNISYEYSQWQNLKDLFRKHVGEVSYIEVFVDDNNKPKGRAVVEFAESSSVKKCLEVMHQFDLNGRKLVVKNDSGNERDRHGVIVNGSRGIRDRESSRDRRLDRRADRVDIVPRGLADDDKLGPTWGLSPQFLDSLGIQRPLVNRVFIANLDYKVDEKKLQEIFKLAGKVIDIDFFKDKEGKSRGSALIEYDHPVEAVQAISMFNNQLLYDRVMTVRMDLINDAQVRIPEGLKGMGMGLGVNGQPLRNVSQHLRSVNSTVSDINNSPNVNAAGILGAVPNSNLNLTSLSNVTPTLANLASLQNLGVPNQLFGNNLSDLSNLNLNPSLVNSLSGGLFTGGMGSFSGQQQPVSGNRDFGTGRDYEQSNQRGYDLGPKDNEYRDDFRAQSAALYSSVNNGAQRSQPMPTRDNDQSDTVIVSNLSTTVSWKMLREKFNCCGDIRYVKSEGDRALIRFANSWEAEKAIQLMDRTRIDGRTIEVRLF